MSTFMPARNCLCYSSPAKGGWSIVRVSLLVPESYQLFVGSPACMRHIKLSCMSLGTGDRVSCLFPEESDVVSGSYETLIFDGACDLLTHLVKKPKVLMIFVTCMDDLLGTDHEAFLAPLRKRFPGVRTIICHMNPLMAESDMPPGVSIHDKMYGLLDPVEEKERAVNFIGNHIAYPEQNELICHLKEHGFSTYHVSQFHTFQEYQRMACATLTVVAAPPALYAARRMEERLGIGYAGATPVYTYDEIDGIYQNVCSYLDIPAVQSKEQRERVDERLKRLREVLCGRPVAIDHGATYSPFSMARLLLDHGINVDTIYITECPAYEKENAAAIEKYGVELIRPEVFVPMKYRRKRDSVCIGFEAAYLEGSPYVMTLSADDDLFGYEGIMMLADRMEDAAIHAMELQELIDDHVLVV